jgi:hypothetical protein
MKVVGLQSFTAAASLWVLSSAQGHSLFQVFPIPLKNPQPWTDLNLEPRITMAISTHHYTISTDVAQSWSCRPVSLCRQMWGNICECTVGVHQTQVHGNVVGVCQVWVCESVGVWQAWVCEHAIGAYQAWVCKYVVGVCQVWVGVGVYQAWIWVSVAAGMCCWSISTKVWYVFGVCWTWAQECIWCVSGMGGFCHLCGFLSL